MSVWLCSCWDFPAALSKITIITVPVLRWLCITVLRRPDPHRVRLFITALRRIVRLRTDLRRIVRLRANRHRANRLRTALRRINRHRARLLRPRPLRRKLRPCPATPLRAAEKKTPEQNFLFRSFFVLLLLTKIRNCFRRRLPEKLSRTPPEARL